MQDAGGQGKANRLDYLGWSTCGTTKAPPHPASCILFYQLNSLAARFRAFDCTWTILPSEIEITRSAISAITALCVITAVVVPNSRLIREIASSTNTPV